MSITIGTNSRKLLNTQEFFLCPKVDGENLWVSKKK
jgi:hypothetical protein